MNLLTIKPKMARKIKEYDGIRVGSNRRIIYQGQFLAIKVIAFIDPYPGPYDPPYLRTRVIVQKIGETQEMCLPFDEVRWLF